MGIFEYLRRETYPVHVMPLSQAEWRGTYPVCKSCRIITFLVETGLSGMIFTPAWKLSGIVETWSNRIKLWANSPILSAHSVWISSKEFERKNSLGFGSEPRHVISNRCVDINITLLKCKYCYSGHCLYTKCNMIYQYMYIFTLLLVLRGCVCPVI